MSNFLKRLISVLAAIVLIGFMAGCSNPDDADSDEPAADATSQTDDADDADADDAEGDEGDEGDDAGFREEPIGDEVFEGPLKIAAVYFQPVTMNPEMGVPFAEAAMHIEADIAAVPDNGLGYGAGDFIPGLTVEYKILDSASGDEVQSGTLMPMNASDGPHYGLNTPALDAGLYKLQFIIHSPEENGWLLHTDAETGVPESFWTEPIVAEFDNWQWDPGAVWW